MLCCKLGKFIGYFGGGLTNHDDVQNHCLLSFLVSHELFFGEPFNMAAR
jgi:hypothetical protein